jgi:Electron transfer DM13
VLETMSVNRPIHRGWQCDNCGKLIRRASGMAAADAPDNASVQRAGFIDLGTIKGNIGDQNYTLSREVDLSKYEAVSIWCSSSA